jgi:hypothetical protein
MLLAGVEVCKDLETGDRKSGLVRGLMLVMFG